MALVELFTGAQCPPCVAADIAFDAEAVKSYKAADVVLLQYHLHIPGPDPLTNADSEKRQQVLRRCRTRHADDVCERQGHGSPWAVSSSMAKSASPR